MDTLSINLTNGEVAVLEIDAFAITTLTASPWRLFYSNAAGAIIELPFGAANEVFTSTGAASPPGWAAGPLPGLHAITHTDGTDDIQAATNAQHGLATAAQITDLEANTAARHIQGTDTTLGALATDIDMNTNDINNVGVINLGDPAVNGSYRIRINGTDLVIERREAGIWNEKSAITA